MKKHKIKNEQKQEIKRLAGALQTYYTIGEFNVYAFITKLWKKLNTSPEAIIATLSALNFNQPKHPWAYGITVRREYLISQGVKDFLDEHERGKRQERANAPMLIKEIMAGLK